jgi:hypothetical protein
MEPVAAPPHGVTEPAPPEPMPDVAPTPDVAPAPAPPAEPRPQAAETSPLDRREPPQPGPLGETPPPFTPAAERGDLPLAGPPPSPRRRSDEPEGPAAAAERAAPEARGGAAESEPADEEVVRIDREAPAPERAVASDRREADQQLGARLVALQMAVAGGNRGEVEVHLRRTFDLADPGPILDDIFGQGTESDKRVAWPRTGDGAA